jgi:hypothetical protein
MRGFVFIFDALLGLLSLAYILSFVLAAQSPSEKFLLDFSAFRRVCDLLLVAHLSPDYSVEGHMGILGARTCSPPGIPCDGGKEWVCGAWMESRAEGGEVVFEPFVACVEAPS